MFNILLGSSTALSNAASMKENSLYKPASMSFIALSSLN